VKFVLTTVPAALEALYPPTADPVGFGVGLSQQLTATGQVSSGTQYNLTASAGWASTNTAIATINSGGLATAAAVGAADFTFSYLQYVQACGEPPVCEDPIQIPKSVPFTVSPKIMFAGSDVTDKTESAVVGQQIGLFSLWIAKTASFRSTPSQKAIS